MARVVDSLERSFWIAAIVTLVAALPAAPARAEGGTYVALGDSVSAGSGADAGHGFVDRYYAYLQQPGHGGLSALVSLARGGETSTGMRIAGGQLDEAVAAIDGPEDVAVVTLDIGGNEGLSNACPGGFGADGCAFRDNWPAILDRLVVALAADPGEETFQVLAYYNPESGVGGPVESASDTTLLGSDQRIDCGGTGAAIGLNDAIVCTGRSEGATPVDAYPTFKAGGQSLIAGDGIHPNEAGHALIACLFEHPDRAGSASPCEAPPSPPPSPPPVQPPARPADTLAPALTLGRNRAQHVLEQRGVRLVVTSGEAATVTAAGRIRAAGRPARRIRLGTTTRTVRPGARVVLKLRLSRKALARTRILLRHGRRLKARVTVRAVDAAGNTRIRTRTVRLVK